MSSFNLISVKYGVNGTFDPWIEDGQADAWFKNMAGSEQYFGWLSEYDADQPVIGSYGGQFTIGASILQRSIIVDGHIQSTLAAAIDQSELSKPDEETLYIVHIPQGVAVDFDRALSCTLSPTDGFCGYHSYFEYGGMKVKYSVLPFTSDCPRCAQTFERFGVTASHEIADTITDPLGTSWVDKCGEEIGDICNDMIGTARGSDGKDYPVQLLWSNRRNKCYGGDASIESVTTMGSSTTEESTEGWSKKPNLRSRR